MKRLLFLLFSCVLFFQPYCQAQPLTSEESPVTLNGSRRLRKLRKGRQRCRIYESSQGNDVARYPVSRMIVTV